MSTCSIPFAACSARRGCAQRCRRSPCRTRTAAGAPGSPQSARTRRRTHPVDAARTRAGPRLRPGRGRRPVPFAAWQVRAGRAATRAARAGPGSRPATGASARDHVVHGPSRRQLQLDADESRALLAAMQPFSRRTASRSHTTRPLRWLARGEIFRDLPTASLDRVVGRTIDELDAPRRRRPRRCAACRRRCRCCCTPTASTTSAQRARPAAGQFVLGQRHRRAARRPRRQAPRACGHGRPARRRRCADDWRGLGRGLAAARRAANAHACWPTLDAARERDADAVRRPQRAALVAPCGARPGAPGPRSLFSRAERGRRAGDAYEDHRPRHSAARRLGAGAGRHASAAGAPLCGARRARQGRTGRRPGPPAAARRPERRARGRRAAGRCDRGDKRLCIVADYDCDGATACAVALRGLRLLGAQHVELPRARPRGRRLWPHAADRRARQGAAAPTC